MTNVITAFENLCTVLESVVTPTDATKNYWCCNNKTWGKLYCAEPAAAAFLGISDLNSANPVCDFSNTAGGICEDDS